MAQRLLIVALLQETQMPDWYGTTGRTDLVGGAVFYEQSQKCSHRDKNMCPLCAELTPDETAAIRKYLEILKQRNDTP